MTCARHGGRAGGPGCALGLLVLTACAALAAAPAAAQTAAAPTGGKPGAPGLSLEETLFPAPNNGRAANGPRPGRGG